MSNQTYRVVGTTTSGERCVFGFGFTREKAEAFAAKKRTEDPINVFTKLPYTYVVEQGGAPQWINQTRRSKLNLG